MPQEIVKYLKTKAKIMSMSKRRHHEIEASANHEHTAHTEHAKQEEHKENPATYEKSTKTGQGMMKYLPFVVIAAVFLAAGFLASSLAGFGGAKTGDQLIFISPPGCTNCGQLETLAKDVAKTLNVPFVKTGFAQQIQNPGIVLVYQNISTITGVDTEYTLKTQMCLITKNTDICNQAQKLTPLANNTQPTPEVTKSDKPVANAFVMSYCPYGLQFMKAYIPVIELLGSKADIQVNFVHYVMHGEKEMLENTRMYCIQKEQKDKFTQYLRCFVEDGNATRCIGVAGIDSAKLDACFDDVETQFQAKKIFNESTGNYPAYPVEAALAAQYGVGGSPTFILNGAEVSVNRSPEAIKQAICAAFNTPPAECNTQLSTAAEAAGLGPIGSGTTASSGSASQCG